MTKCTNNCIYMSDVKLKREGKKKLVYKACFKITKAHASQVYDPCVKLISSTYQINKLYIWHEDKFNLNYNFPFWI